jgi:HlyD family secretion protein
VRLALIVLAACTQVAEPRTAPVTRGDLVVTVPATGSLAAVDTTNIMPPTISTAYSFKMSWLAPEGAAVAAGDPIVSFDTTDLDRELQAERSEVDAASKRLDKRRQEVVLQRGTDAVRVLEAEAAARKAALAREAPPELVAQLDVKDRAYDDELAKMALAEVQRSVAYMRQSDDTDLASTEMYLATTRARLAELEGNLANMSVSSPRAGTVVYLFDYFGHKRGVGADAWRGDPCVQVVGLDAMVGRGEVDEVDLPRVAVHQPVAIHLEALPDVALRGSVQEVATAVSPHSFDDPSNVAPVAIQIDATDAALRPGMRFRADVEVARVAGVLQVPATAVTVTADGPIVTLASGERRPVELGRRSHDAIEVLSGLALGDEVELP